MLLCGSIKIVDHIFLQDYFSFVVIDQLVFSTEKNKYLENNNKSAKI